MLSRCRRALYPAPVALLLCAFVLPHVAHAQRMRITVGGPNFRPFPVAVAALSTLPGSDLSAGQPAAETLTTLVRSDVDLLRLFSLVPPKTYLAKEGDMTQPPSFASWQDTGASGLIRGSVRSIGTQLAISLQFYDVAAHKEVIARTYQVAPADAVRAVHQFLDAVIAALTGDPGIFSSRIAFVARQGKSKTIFACDFDGSGLEKLLPSNTLNLLPNWDASGRYLFFTSYLAGNADLYRLSTVTKRIEAISRQRGLNTGANVSPDGKRIALTLSKDGNTEIYVMDWDGRNLRRLTDSWGQDVSPVWSPDSKRIAFVSSRSGNPHIYVMDADGKNVHRLTFRGTYNQEPDWSPRADGQIVFTARDEKLIYDVFLVHPDTGEVTRLTEGQGHNESPVFSPDGQHIAFTSTREGHGKQLWAMDVDGQNPRPVAPGIGDVETPAWGPRLGY